MKISESLLFEFSQKYGESFYLLDSAQFSKNYNELLSAFKSIYDKTQIAYSYKTNYIPKFCKIVNDFGGYAEVVSDMELEIARRIGVPFNRIIWNGPYKNSKVLKDFLLCGGTVNIDSVYEIKLISQIAYENPDKFLNVGIRCNFDINDNVLSRFGFDIESTEFSDALGLVNTTPNIHFTGLQCHFASRTLETWHPRAEGMLKLVDRIGIIPEQIDLGGGLFGKMEESLKTQFHTYIPSYVEYAREAATVFAKKFVNLEVKPELVIEPGSALVGDCMKFAAKVINIKQVRGKFIATLLGSIYNINPTLNKKNPPLNIYHMGDEINDYTNLDFGGFTCIESDYLYRGFNGKLAVGDYVVFDNVGSYSIVLKPPFILPNFPVIDCCDNQLELVKKAEVFDDIFHTYIFE